MQSHDVFKPDGVLAENLPDFVQRPQQTVMAEAIENALLNKEILIIEAGTGTGKTFAYLVPAILSGLKIIISTGTKNLQDQLFHRDIPVLRDALKIPFTAELLKGRNNYLCRHRLNVFYNDGRFVSPFVAREIQTIHELINHTSQGDISELSGIPENSPVWSYVTSNTENCLGADCEFYKNCFVVEARKKAQEANIVVINHHLFCADLALKDTGFGEILPNADAIIIDEAHQLSEAASQFFGESFSSRQISFLIDDAKTTIAVEANDITLLLEQGEKLKNFLIPLRDAFGPAEQRRPWDEIAHKPLLKTCIAEFKLLFFDYKNDLEKIAPRSKNLESLWRRAADLYLQFANLTDAIILNHIHWYETFQKSFSIHLTPITIAEKFEQHLTQNPMAWIFTSATLAVKNDFQHFKQNLGLKEAKTLLLPCPFDYETQTKLYIPENLPDPSDQNYTKAVLNAALPVIEIVGGRTFMLFTSHAALQLAARFLQNKLSFPLLVQGEGPKVTLLENFRKLGNGVLLGTHSFWEGVDVKGEALSCVIIDKLPFSSPSDPILKARIAALRKLGKDPFQEYQLSQAVISLKQGTGRLIRDVSDRGILMICDPRILSRPYGKIFLESLPLMPVTRDITEIKKFFET